MMEKKEECVETVQKKNFTDAYVAAQCRYHRRRFHGRGSSVWYQSVVRGDHDRIETAKAAIFRMVVCCMQIRDFR